MFFRRGREGAGPVVELTNHLFDRSGHTTATCEDQYVCLSIYVSVYLSMYLSIHLHRILRKLLRIFFREGCLKRGVVRANRYAIQICVRKRLDLVKTLLYFRSWSLR